LLVFEVFFPHNWCMKTKESVADAPQGGDQAKKVLSLSDVKGLLKRDLPACINMLVAIHDDQDTLDALAVVLHGKYLNKIHKEDLEKQSKLGL